MDSTTFEVYIVYFMYWYVVNMIFCSFKFCADDLLASTSVDVDHRSASTSMDAYSELVAIDVDVYLPDLLRFQIRKRLRKCFPWFRKPSPNGNPTLPNFISDPSSIKHPISDQI